MVKEIPLTRGKVALVDDEDYRYLKHFNWYYSGKYARGGGYAKVMMHRVIVDPPDGYYVDHVNGDKLDNRRSNLRMCTLEQNSFNSKLQKNNTSGYKGVSWDKQKNKWRAKITHQGKTRHIGLYDNKHEAAIAYNEEAKELFGEFAWLNEVKEVS
jgi:hypothetical protein